MTKTENWIYINGKVKTIKNKILIIGGNKYENSFMV
jgi:hypothetical protein